MRNVKKDFILFGGYFILEGFVVMMCFLSLYKNLVYWDNLLKFDLDRWFEQGFVVQVVCKGFYIFFVVGKRGCVGFNLVLVEVKMVLVELVYNYKFEDVLLEVVVYDLEFLVIWLFNFYVSVMRRMEWLLKRVE